MGCDIHLHVERNIPGIGWIALEEADTDKLTNRNYDVFAILANVRNGRGFAGIVTGSGFNPISEPRGLPSNISEIVKAASDYWDIDGHSHSWLSLREILEYDYNQTTVHRGVLSFEEFKHFDEYREFYPSPKSWSGSVSGNNIITIQDEEARLMTHQDVEKDSRQIYVNTTWKTRYLDNMTYFLAELVPYIKYGLDDIRLVFWFDN